jgi:hypothetical protein
MGRGRSEVLRHSRSQELRVVAVPKDAISLSWTMLCRTWLTKLRDLQIPEVRRRSYNLEAAGANA